MSRSSRGGGLACLLDFASLLGLRLGSREETASAPADLRAHCRPMKRILLSLITAVSLAACGGGASSSEPATETQTASAETSGAEQAALVPIGETQIGDRSTCPVSGEEFVVAEHSPTVEHEGRTYHFCCPGCAQRFEADPARFLQAQDGEAAAAETTEG